MDLYISYCLTINKENFFFCFHDFKVKFELCVMCSFNNYLCGVCENKQQNRRIFFFIIGRIISNIKPNIKIA